MGESKLFGDSRRPRALARKGGGGEASRKEPTGVKRWIVSLPLGEDVFGGWKMTREVCLVWGK